MPLFHTLLILFKVLLGAITPFEYSYRYNREKLKSPPGSHYASFSYSFNIVIYIREKSKMSLREPLHQFLIQTSFYSKSHWEPLRRFNIVIYIREKSKKVSPGAITPLSPTLLIFFKVKREPLRQFLILF